MAPFTQHVDQPYSRAGPLVETVTGMGQVGKEDKYDQNTL